MSNARAYLEAACHLCGVTVEQFCAPGRRPMAIVPYRHAVMRMARRDGLSFAQIGRILKRDQTTVVHAVCNLPNDSLQRAIEAEREIVAIAGTVSAPTVPATFIGSRNDGERVEIERGERRPAVAPIPPGALCLLRGGASRTYMRRLFPEWRGLE